MTYPMEATYRYNLTRSWGGSSNIYSGRICWVMLNPSTADEHLDDPTIRRVIGFSERWGFAELVVVNLFAVRSTDPKNLEMFEDPIGQHNAYHLADAMANSRNVMAAWGASGIPCMKAPQIAGVRRISREQRIMLWCLGTTKDGSPRHPLYVKADTKPVIF